MSTKKFNLIMVFLLVLFSNLFGIRFNGNICICEAGDFEFEIPGDDWNYVIIEEAVNQENFFELTIDLSSRKNYLSFNNDPAVIISIEDINAISMESYFDAIPYILSLPSKNYTVFDTGNAIVGGLQAKWIVMEYNPGYPFDENYTVKIKQYYLLRDYPDIPLPRAYFITYISDEEYFGNFIDLFEDIVQSLKPI